MNVCLCVSVSVLNVCVYNCRCLCGYVCYGLRVCVVCVILCGCLCVCA